MSDPATSDAGPPYGSDWIRRLLPHRYPMLMIDRVLEIEPGRRIVALKNVSHNEDFFVGHFPEEPVMPGVLVIEALAQAAGLIALAQRDGASGLHIYLTGVDKAKFRRPVVPGDQLRLEAEVIRLRSTHGRFACRALVDDKVAVQAICSSSILDTERS
ncbi:MAG: 3-hydroxyacyl-ACP dehydratase FabZ [Acidobacteriota bacterium]